MGSMSYCLFENTASELGECVDRMESARSLSSFLGSRSEYEKRGYYAMRRLCQDFLAADARLSECQLQDDVEELMADEEDAY